MSEPGPVREVEVVRTTPLSSSVSVMVLRTADARPLHWHAGQHIELRVPDLPPERQRPFSIASAPDPAHPGQLEIAIARDDNSATASTLLSLKRGTRLRMEGPKGELTRGGVSLDGPILMVATGTGVAPLRAVLQAELANRPDGPELVLLFGCRTEEDVLWGDEFRALRDRYARFRFEPTLSQPPLGWTGRTGYVQEHIAELVRSLGRVPVWICGRPEMVGEAQRVLETLSHPEALVFTEKQG